MVKVYIANRHSLNQEILNKELEIVDNPKDAEFAICWKRVPEEVTQVIPLNRIVMVETEPPIHLLGVYQHFPLFHTSITFNPKGKNEFSFGKAPHLYPYGPSEGLRTKRADTTIKNRKCYFAGRADIKSYHHTEEAGSKTIYSTRTFIAKVLESKEHFIYGLGFNKQTKRTDIGWHRQKFEDLEKDNPDFMLCMENSIMPNYISEKIWDGLLSDRVTLYLGCPNVTDYIPENCFIHLNKYMKDGIIDVKKIEKIMNQMTQEEYDTYLENARNYLDKVAGNGKKYKDQLTKFIVDRINGESN